MSFDSALIKLNKKSEKSNMVNTTGWNDNTWVRQKDSNLLKYIKPASVGDDIGIQTMRADMLKDLRTRYEEVETNTLCALATVLDPTSYMPTPDDEMA